ncbi:DUF4225 domain-containing protein [Pseudomonas syringae]|uniref:DUF4225 domain-containing protein n=1 Tax=Pseudomonas syringae CC1417 TaxID=1357272 RepID=A0AAU8LC17_PSESX
MSLPGRRTTERHNLWRVREAATHLAGQACTLSARHINDGTLRLQFNREVAYYARSIVRDVEAGTKSVDEGLKAIKAEQNGLLRQSSEIGQKTVGLAAGVLQVTGGVGVCYASAGMLCAVFGGAMIAHGANNIYENGRNLLEDRSDVEGPVRKGYQAVAKVAGKRECAGNTVYGMADLGLSAYGVFRLVIKPDAWRLFKYYDADKIRAYKTTPLAVLVTERASDTVTAASVFDQLSCLYE